MQIKESDSESDEDVVQIMKVTQKNEDVVELMKVTQKVMKTLC